MRSNARVRALLLAGGYSRRFGMDKAVVRLQPDGLTALEVLAQRIQSIGLGVFLSMRPDQEQPASQPESLEVVMNFAPI